MGRHLRGMVLLAGLFAGPVGAAPVPPVPPDMELLEFLGGVDGMPAGTSQEPPPQTLKKTLPAKPTEPAPPTPGERPTKSN